MDRKALIEKAEAEIRIFERCSRTTCEELVKALKAPKPDWEDPATRAKVLRRARELWNEDQFSCSWSDENREHYMIRAAMEMA